MTIPDSLILIIALALVVLVVFIGILPLLFGVIFRRRYKLGMDKLAELEAETRSTMGQVAVGLGGFVVLWTAIESMNATSQSLSLTRDSLELTEGGQLADRFSGAIDMLNNNTSSGADIVGVDVGTVARVGGVFALDQIVQASGDYREPALHALAAMVQRESPRSPSAESAGTQRAMVSPAAGSSQPAEVEPAFRTGSPQEGSYRFRPCDWLDAHRGINPHAPGPDHEVPAPDVAAALTVIGRLVASSDELTPNLELTRNLDMSQAELCVAYAPKSKLVGVWFRHSDLRGAILDGADLTGAGLVSADLTGAHLPKAKLENSNLKDATLNKADLCGAKLSGADLQGAKLEDTNLSGADLQAAKNLTEKQLAQACGSDKTLLPHGWGIEDCAKKISSGWNEIPTSIC